MSWDHHSNTILSGLLDYYCLCCEEHFKFVEDVNKHLADSEHISNQRNAKYLVNYENHGIRQFSIGYHCQFCNKVLSTVLQVKSHVKDNVHIQHLLTRTAKRENDNTIVINTVVISADSWHGLVENSCVVCDEDVKSKEHGDGKDHILNLIRSEVQIDGHGNVFRQLQQKDIQCLSCNVLLDKEKAKTHFEEPAHKALITHFISTSDDKVKQDNLNQEVINEIRKKDTCESIPGTSTHEDQAATTDVKEGNSKENVKQMQLVRASNELIKSNEDVEEISVDELENLTKTNGIQLGHKQAMCNVCKKTISSTLKCLKEHISGAKHKENLETFKSEVHTSFKLNKKSTFEYIEEFAVYDNEFMYLNNFALPYSHFHILISRVEFKRCQVCRENLVPCHTNLHCREDGHMKRLLRIPVITNFQSDFIREIRPNIYYCGFCNCPLIGIHMVLKHKSTLAHRLQKQMAYKIYHVRRTHVETLRFMQFMKVCLKHL